MTGLRDRLRSGNVPPWVIGGIVLLLMAVGAYVRIWGISRWQISRDDAYLQWLATIPALVPTYDFHDTPWHWITAAFIPKEHWWQLFNVTPVSGHPAFFYILLDALQQLTLNPMPLRMLAFIPAMATIPLAYFLGKQVSGRLSGVIAALLITFSDIHIVISQEIRSYALFTFLVMCMYYAILRYDATRRGGWVKAYFALALVSMFTHYGAVIQILCIGTAGALRLFKANRYSVVGALKDKNFLIWCGIHALYAGLYVWQHTILMSTVGSISAASDAHWAAMPLWMQTLLASMVMFQMPGNLFFADCTLFFIMTSFMTALGLWALWRDKKFEWFGVALGSLVITWALLVAGMHPFYAVRHFAHMFPVLLICCSYPFSQSLKLDEFKTTAIFVGVFFVFFTVNLFGPLSNGIDPDRYRVCIRFKYDRQYEVTEADSSAMEKELNAHTRPGDALAIDQLHWMLLQMEEKKGNEHINMFLNKHYHVCTQPLILYHMQDMLFSNCLKETVAAFPGTRRVWYIFPNRGAHIQNYEGDTLLAHPRSIQLEKEALEKITFPTIGAYAMSPDYFPGREE